MPHLCLQEVPLDTNSTRVVYQRHFRDTDIKTTTVMRSVDSRLGNVSRSSVSFGICFLTFVSQDATVRNNGMNHCLGVCNKPEPFPSLLIKHIFRGRALISMDVKHSTEQEHTKQTAPLSYREEVGMIEPSPSSPPF